MLKIKHSHPARYYLQQASIRAPEFLLWGACSLGAFCIASANVHDFSYFWIWVGLAVSAGFSLLIGLAAFGAGMSLQAPKATPPSGSSRADLLVFLLVLLLVMAVVTVYMLLSTPLMAWDSLGHWAPSAITILDRAEHMQVAGPDDLSMRRHSAVYSVFLATARYFDGLTMPLGLEGFFWFLVVMATFLLIFYSCCVAELPALLSMLAAFVYISLPYVENHHIQQGYTELFVSFFCAALFLSIQMFHKHKELRFLFFAVLLFGTLFFARNTGPIYALVVASISVFVFFPMCRKWLGASLLVIVVVLFIVGVSFSFDFGGMLFLLDYQNGIVRFAGYKWKFYLFEITNLGVIANNLLHMLAVNSSFSIVSVSALVTYVGLLFDAQRCRGRVGPVVHACFFIFLSGVLLTTAVQFTPKGFRDGSVGSDTGLTRAFLPFVSFGVVVCFQAARRCVQRFPIPKTEVSGLHRSVS